MTEKEISAFALNSLAKALNIKEQDVKKDGIFINGEVPSKKNSKRWTGKTLISSKATLRYEKTAGYEYAANRHRFSLMAEKVHGTVYVGIYFVRKTKRRFDYNNIGQTVMDMMVQHEWIKDDDAVSLVPVFLGHHTDKKTHGVYIYMLYL